MRTHHGTPEDSQALKVWQTVFNEKDVLSPSVRIELAAWLIWTALDSTELEQAEEAEALLAAIYAWDALSGAGW